MNLAIITGNLTRDPEMRYTPSGKAVTEFTVANNEGRGEHEVTTYFRCTAWERLAETVAEYARKGKRVAVVGSLSLEQYTTRDGEKRASLRLSARQVEFLSPRETTERTPAMEEAEAELANLPF